MPSPTEVTVPTSLTSIPTRYPSICSRMILLISSAFISMPNLSVLSQSTLKRLQLLPDGSVINCAANLGNHSSNQGGIHSDIHAHLLSRDPLQFCGQFPLLLRVQRYCGCHVSPHEPEFFV